jgi:hypothetical protein
MFRLDAKLKVYVHREAVDFRKSINGLAALVCAGALRVQQPATGSHQDTRLGWQRLLAADEISGFILQLLYLDVRVLSPVLLASVLRGQQADPIDCNVSPAGSNQELRRGTHSRCRHVW